MAWPDPRLHKKVRDGAVVSIKVRRFDSFLVYRSGAFGINLMSENLWIVASRFLPAIEISFVH